MNGLSFQKFKQKEPVNLYNLLKYKEGKSINNPLETLKSVADLARAVSGKTAVFLSDS